MHFEDFNCTRLRLASMIQRVHIRKLAFSACVLAGDCAD